MPGKRGSVSEAMTVHLDTEQRDIYTVSRLNEEVRDLLETSFPMLWIEGEISNLARPASGHIYFSLKDKASQVRCAMFRSQNRLLRFKPENGLHVLLRARISLYPSRGDFQLIVESMQEFGEGALQRAFEELKTRLSQEGLFDAERKRALPALPHRIGVITSPSGAAIRDVITVLGRRFPALPVLIYPAPVQGEEAVAGIVEALHQVAERKECDVLLLVRGGGSLEDLWAFNSERVARAIAACPVPVVTGIGHEIDFTIADFVADHRAATPSAAAETVTPDQPEWRHRLSRTADRLRALARGKLQLEQQRVAWLTARVQHPRRPIMELSQRIDGLTLKLAAAHRSRLQRETVRLQQVTGRLHRQHPDSVLREFRACNVHLGNRLWAAWRYHQDQSRSRLAALTRALNAVSPLATLDRGYAIITSDPEDKLIQSVDATSEGRRIRARLADGTLLCTVDTRLKQDRSSGLDTDANKDPE